ncbi:gluconate 2-dehydrogenase subunit 3 family protein [Desulfobacterota bacterium AH_259_B03_O07]|nr:gluconate 2-dehydrogenase subunit 3 family protein [Desulfobacterota bacterium AH_259_B03_O07]
MARNNDSGQFTRRKFIGVITSFSLYSTLIPVSTFLSCSNEKNEDRIGSKNLGNHKFKFFNPNQSAIIEEVISLIIPTDGGPGAREAGVVFELDNIVSGSDYLQEIYTGGIDWLGYMARELYKKNSFLDLTQDEKIEILNIADHTKFFTAKGDKLATAYGNIPIAIIFFSNIKDKTIDLFYSGELGWRVVGYHGPPQWSGFPDYYKCS